MEKAKGAVSGKKGIKDISYLAGEALDARTARSVEIKKEKRDAAVTAKRKM